MKQLRVAVLSRSRTLHSIRRLIHEAKAKNIHIDVIDPLSCQLIVNGQESKILVNGRTAHHYDAVLPRIGASITEYGIAVVKQFESLGMRTINSSNAILESRDKLRCLQLLSAAGLKVPTTVLTRSYKGLKPSVNAIKGFPVVLKVIRGTQGIGVMIVHTPVSLSSVLDTMWGLNEDVLLQQFIADGAGRDYRLFVIGNKVVATMMRTAAKGEFRSNIHRGGEGHLVKLPRSYITAALKAVRAMGLHIAGVDLMESAEGPKILEVNSSPGFEGIEQATKMNVAKLIVDHIIRECSKPKRRRKK